MQPETLNADQAGSKIFILLFHFLTKIFLVISFILLFYKSNFSQNYLEEQYLIAENLYNRQDFFDAITELKRLLFFDSLSIYTYKANYLIGKSYKGGTKYDEAIKHFSIASNKARSPVEKYNSKIEVIRCNILRKTTDQALLLLMQIENDSITSGRKNEINYWRGWAYIFAEEWRKAADSFQSIDENHQLRKLTLNVHQKQYSVFFAKLISYILPGSGQFYTGNYLSGLMSLGWTGLFTYLTVKSFQADRIFDGIITTGLFFRFHRGNVENAENFALKKNYQHSKDALFYLQNFYIGEKP